MSTRCHVSRAPRTDGGYLRLTENWQDLAQFSPWKAPHREISQDLERDKSGPWMSCQWSAVCHRAELLGTIWFRRGLHLGLSWISGLFHDSVGVEVVEN